MPKIPTFTAESRPTADAPGVVSNIQISPTSTVAASLLPAAEKTSKYFIKQRDNTEKLEAKKIALELKAEGAVSISYPKYLKNLEILD